MKLGSLEKNGLRCLVRIGLQQERTGQGLTLAEVSQAEGLSVPNVAKVMRVLRIGGFVRSTRGHAGGYALARSCDEITVGQVLAVLGGRLFEPDFCVGNGGSHNPCPHATTCPVRPVWARVQTLIDTVLCRVTLRTLYSDEREVAVCILNAGEDLE
jgi:Rrf2 family transcriptional regulator, iron-sulfur cluster assembly transcription factor